MQATNDNLYPFEHVRGVFRPTCPDTLREGFRPLIGQELTFRAMWQNQPEELNYPGEWALFLLPEPGEGHEVVHSYWVPLCDIENPVILEREKADV